MKLQLSMAHFTLYYQGATGLRDGPSFDGSALHRTGCQVTSAHVSASNQQRLGLFAVLFLNMDLIPFYSFSPFVFSQAVFLLGEKDLLGEHGALSLQSLLSNLLPTHPGFFSQSSLSFVAI